jgi:hypothetical protein
LKVKVRIADHRIKGVINMEMRAAKDNDVEGDGRGIVIKDADIEMQYNDTVEIDIPNLKDESTDHDLPV